MENDKGKLAGQNKRRGRANEVAIAKRLGGKGIGALGGEDIFHPDMSIEAKSFKRFLGETIMQQAEANSKEGKLTISVVHIKNQSRDKDIVMMRMTDFEELIK